MTTAVDTMSPAVCTDVLLLLNRGLQAEGKAEYMSFKLRLEGTKPSQVKLSRPLSLFAHVAPSPVPSLHVFHTISLSLSSLEVADDVWYRYTVHSPV